MDPYPNSRLWLTYLPEGLALLALGALLAVTYQGSTTLPARVPTHFGAAGRPDAWGSPSSFYFLAGMAVILYLGLTAVQRFPRIYNYPVRVTEENRPRLEPLAVGMLRWMKAEMLGMFAYVQWATVQVAMRQAAGLSPAVTLVWIAALLVTTLGFILWMRRVG